MTPFANDRPTFHDFVECWNNAQDLSTPAVHRRMTRWLEERWRAGDRQLLLLAFRSSGKSTICGLFAAWLLVVDASLRILVLSAEAALARKMVRNVKRIVERHPMAAVLRPASRDEWASDRFTVARPRELRDPSVLARGIGANLTGSRADVVICDDVEVPNTSDTPAKREDLRERLGEIDYILMPGGLQVYLGTPHSYYSIYAPAPRGDAGEDAAFLEGFRRLELPVVDATGASAWPERFTAAHIAAIERRTGSAKFRSQMLLMPVDPHGGYLDPDRLRRYDAELVYDEGNRQPVLSLGGRRLVSASCYWDPAFGGRDASVIAAVFTCEQGQFWLHRVLYLDPPSPNAAIDEATQACRQVVDFARDLHVPSITIETNGLGRFLPGILRRELARAEVASAVREDQAVVAKHRRILGAFESTLAAGMLAAHARVWRTRFIAEMRAWRPRSGAADDGLDAVSGCLLSEPARLSPSAPRRRRDWRPGQTPRRAETAFEV